MEEEVGFSVTANTGNSEPAVNKLTASILNLDKSVIKLTGDMSKVGGSFGGVQSQMANASKSASTFGAALGGVTKIATSLGLTIGAWQIVNVIKAVANAAIEFESSFAGVKKTIDGTEAEFQALSDGFRQLAQEIPVSVNEINKIGEAAGQLGIQKDKILGFTKVMADLGATTNLSSDQAATALARLANITQMPQDQFSNLGSVVVDLGNKFAATESEIVEMGTRIAATGAQVGLSEGQILAFGAALSSVGIDAEAGGTAISKVFITLAESVSTGGLSLADFAKVAGTSAAEFKKAFQEDAANATKMFIEGLGKIKEAGGDTLAVVASLGIEEVRMRNAVLALAGAGDLLGTALDAQNKAWKENSALTKEAEQRYQTAESQIQMAKNAVNDLAISLGGELKTGLADAAKGIIEFIGDNEADILAMGKAFAELGKSLLSVGAGLGKVAPQIIGFFTTVIPWIEKLLKYTPNIASLFYWAEKYSNQLLKNAQLMRDLQGGLPENMIPTGSIPTPEQTMGPSLNLSMPEVPKVAFGMDAKALTEMSQATGVWVGQLKAAAPAIKTVSEEQKKAAETAAKLKQAFMDQLQPMAALEAEFAELAKTGVTYDQFITLNSENIKKAAETQKQFDQALTESQKAMLLAANEIDRYIVAADGLTESNKQIFFSAQEVADSFDYESGATSGMSMAGVEYTAVAQNIAKYNAEVAASSLAAAEAANKQKEETAKLVQEMFGFAEILSKLAQSFGGPLGSALDLAAEGFAAVGQAIEEGGDAAYTATAAFGAVTSAMIGMGGVLADIGNMAQGGFNIASGFATGDPIKVIGGIIQAVGGLASALSKLFGKDWGKEASKQVALLTGGLEVSQELMEQITKDAEEMGNAFAAALVNLPAIFEEVGVNMDNFFQLSQSVQDVFSGVEQGIISAAQANEILADTFPQLLEAAMEFGGEYMDRLQEIVAIAADTGLGVDAMKEALVGAINEIKAKVAEAATSLNDALTPVIAFLKTEVTSAFTALIPDAIIPVEAALKTIDEATVEAFNKLIEEGKTAAQAISELGLSLSQVRELFDVFNEGMGFTSEQMENLEQTAYGLAGTVLSAFNAMIAGGASIQEALAAISPNLGELREVFKALGISFADVGLGFLNQMDQINKKFPEQTAAINGVTQALASMRTLGITPSAQQFAALQGVASKALQDIAKDGEFSKAELALMMPTLQALSAAATEYGFALDPVVQAAIDAAKENGTWKESDPAPTLTETMTDLLAVLEKLNTTLGLLTGEATAFGDALDDATVDRVIDIKFQYTGGDVPEGMGARQDAQRYATLQSPKTFWETQGIIVDPGETLLPKNWNMSGNAGVSMGNVSVTVNVNGGPNMKPIQFKQAVQQAVIDGMQKAGSLSDLRPSRR